MTIVGQPAPGWTVILRYRANSHRGGRPGGGDAERVELNRPDITLCE